MIAEGRKKWKKTCPIVWEVMQDDSHWSHDVMLVVICQASITVSPCSTVCELALRRFKHLSTSVDPASPIIKPEPYILLIYTTRDMHLHATWSMRRLRSHDENRVLSSGFSLCLCLFFVQPCSQFAPSQEHSYMGRRIRIKKQNEVRQELWLIDWKR